MRESVCENILFERRYKTQMPIYAKGRKFENVTPGLHAAAVKNVELFVHESWGERVRITFETALLGAEGQNLSVFHEASLNLSPLSKLSGIAESLLGRQMTEAERENGFDVESLIGIGCEIVVKQRTSEKTGNAYSVVDAIIKEGTQQTETPSPQQPAQADKAQNISDVNVEFANAGSKKEEVPF